MPAGFLALLPIILAGASAAAGGIGLGESLANQPGHKPIPAPPPAPLTPAQTGSIKSLISGQDANIQAQTGGSLSPDYLTQIAPILAGTAGPGTSGIAQGATNTFTGGSNPIAQVIRALSTGGGGAAPSASAQSFAPAGLSAQPGSAAGDYVDSGLSSLYKSLGIAG